MKKLLIIISIILVIILGILYISKESSQKEEPLPIKLQQPEFFLSEKPTNELVLQACEYYGIKHSKIVLAQAILETGNYQSGNCRIGNNLFGLYNSKKQEFFTFDKWYHSVEFYRNNIQSRYKGEEDYYKWLEKIGYAEDTLYVQKLKRIAKIYNIK